MDDIKYQIKAYVNDELVYKGEFLDTTALQENGIRKAELAVGVAVNLLEDDNER